MTDCRSRSRSRAPLRRRAVPSSSRASTVTIALVSLAVAGIPLVTTMGLMAAIAVVVAVIAALTLLPAALALLGPRINSLRVRRPPSEEQARATGSGRSGRTRSQSSRVIAGLAALAILIPLTIPLLSLTLGQQDTAALSKSTTARQAYDLIAQNFGPGVERPALDRGLARLAGAERRQGSAPRDVAEGRRLDVRRRRRQHDAGEQGRQDRALQRDLDEGTRRTTPRPQLVEPLA